MSSTAFGSFLAAGGTSSSFVFPPNIFFSQKIQSSSSRSLRDLLGRDKSPPKEESAKEHKQVDCKEDQHGVGQPGQVAVVECLVLARKQELHGHPAGSYIVAQEQRRPAHGLVFLRMQCFKAIEKQLDEYEPYGDHATEEDEHDGRKCFGIHAHRTPGQLMVVGRAVQNTAKTTVFFASDVVAEVAAAVRVVAAARR